jgi:hypothetical protein
MLDDVNARAAMRRMGDAAKSDKTNPTAKVE